MPRIRYRRRTYNLPYTKKGYSRARRLVRRGGRRIRYRKRSRRMY